MRDYLAGRGGEIYATFDYVPDAEIEHYFRGEIIDYRLPSELTGLLAEYSEILDGMALSLLDEVEAKIASYQLHLKNAGTSVFNLEIVNKTSLTFFDRYPTAKGFIDRHPGSGL